MINYKYLTGIALLLMSACTVHPDSTPKVYKDHLKATNPYFMDLETMFPNTDVREVAISIADGELDRDNPSLKSDQIVNYIGTSGSSLLLWSYIERNLDAFELLLENGANPNQKHMKHGSSILHLATKHENISYLKLALVYGGDSNIKTRNGSPPLFEAVGKDLSVLKLLSAHGADINAVGGTTGDHPLIIYSIMLDDYEFTRELIKMGAETNVALPTGKHFYCYVLEAPDDLFRSEVVANSFQHAETCS